MTMDKKHTGVPNGKANGSRNGNRNKNNTVDKLTETTSNLKALNLGGSSIAGQKGLGSINGGSKNNNNNSNSHKSGKKSKASSKTTGSSAVAAQTSVQAPAKKSADPVLLGMPDSPMDPQDDTDPYITKIGGIPSWLDQDVPAPSKYGICKACGKDMYLLLQAYVPLEKSPYDRVVYVWACNQRLCMRKEGSFRVVRALKLNPEYARKLEKKPKLSVAPVTTSASTSGAPLLAANPFATSGATNMGSTLFGGSSVAFNNPFASTTNNINPFAPPPGFGTGTPITTPPCTTIKSFASAASAAITPTEESSSESEEEHDTVEEPSTWPENPVGFDPYYLYITEEVLEDSHPLDDDISQRYSHLMALEEAANRNDASEEDGEDSISAATWSGEAYEKAALPKGVDKAFKKFTKRVQSWPDQCVRYDFPGVPLLFSYSDRTAHLLLPPNVASHSKHTTPSAHRIPRCPSCKGPRGFEFQLMPNLLSLLDVTSKKYLSEEEKKSLKERKGAQVFDIGMEWGTVLVYSCVEDCFGKKATAAAMQGEDDDNSNNNSQKVKYFEEVALVQFED